MKKFDFSVIKILRVKRGLSANDLARQANLTRATVTKIESGGGNPTMETIEALADILQLAASELVRLAEVAKCETARTETFKTNNFQGAHIRFPNFEIYHIQAKAGIRKVSDPQFHENTAEVCLVLSGRLLLTVGGQSNELGPGMALRFKALHDHYFDIIEDTAFLLIHHNLV